MHQLLRIAYSTDPRLAESLSSSFEYFLFSISSDDCTVAQRQKILEQLSSYLRKKAEDALTPVLDENYYNLRRLRNDLMHNKIRRDIELAPMYPLLWRAINKLAEKIGPYEVENLLAYSLFVDNKQYAERGLSPSKVVSEYRAVFRKFNEARKRDVFIELLFRLFSDPESMSLLDLS